MVEHGSDEYERIREGEGLSGCIICSKFKIEE
jgi:hypothetical protein